MRGLFKLISLLLCFELIVSPIAPGLSLVGTKAFAQGSCPAGMQFDSTLNRCLTSAETAKVMNAVSNCAPEDVQCYKQQAQSAFDEKVGKGEAPKAVGNNGFVSGVANIAAIAGPVTMMSMGIAKSASSCASISFWLMVGGSLSLFVGDTLANMQHKNRLKKIKKDWDNIVSPKAKSNDKDDVRDGKLETQGEAFGKLAEAEESLAKAARMKKTFYSVAAVAYGAATAIALVELIAEKVPATGAAEKIKNTCMGKGDEGASDTVDPGTQDLAGEPWTENINGLDNQAVLVASSSYHRSLEYYVHNKKPLTSKDQFLYNIEQSKDFASFLANKKALELSYQSPSLEYYESLTKAVGKDREMNDPVNFNMVKEIVVGLMKNVSPVQSAHAYEEVQEPKSPLLGAGLKAGGGVALGLAAKKLIGKQLVSTEGRAIFSGVMMGLSIIMANHAGKQADASQRRADVLKQMQKDLIAAEGAVYNCKSADRQDPGKPNCYCYTPDGDRNQNRGNSQVCQNLWGGLTAKDGKYLASGSGSRICITKSNKADPSCSCKKTNSCLKVSASGLKGIGPGTMSMLNGALTPLNQLANGADPASLSGSGLAQNAARMSDLVRSLASTPAARGLKSQSAKLSKDLGLQMQRASAGFSGSSLGSASPLPSNAAEAAKILEKEIKKENGPEGVGGSGNAIAVPSNASEKPLEFGVTEDEFAAQEDQVAEVMNENLDFGGNDINQASSTNIFEVLSNRYQRSGMRRLFDEKGLTEAEKPATSDISQ